MANTTNFNWETPDDTDLVKDGAAAIRTLGSAIDTSLVDLKGGTTDQVLAKNSNTDMDFKWVTSDDANAIQNSIIDAKGDLIAASAADTPARLAVGTNNQRLVAASGEATGLKYVSDTQNTVIDAEGDLLVGDSADTLQRLAIGTTGQVLTVDTTVDGKIKWAAAGGGGMTLISTTTLSGATTTITVGSNSYKSLVIFARSIDNATDSDVYVQINGETGATAYTPVMIGNNNGAAYSRYTKGDAIYLNLTGTVGFGSANDNFSVITINDANSTIRKVIDYSVGGLGVSSAIFAQRSTVTVGSTAVISSIDFKTSATQFDGGSILLYGVS